MASQLFPREVAEDSLEAYLGGFRPTRPIYVVTLITVAGALLALPFVPIDVTVQAAGQLRPASEKNTVTAGSSGRIRRVYVSLGQHVKQGAPLIEFETAPIERQAQALQSHLAAIERSTRDLAQLGVFADQALREIETGTVPKADPSRYEDRSYAQQAAQFRAELDAARLQQDAANRGLTRAKFLRSQGFASDSAEMAAEQEVQRAHAYLRLIAARFHAQWQSELSAKLLTSADLRSQLAQTSEQQDRGVVSAPLAGTIEELPSIAAGNFLQAGGLVAVISPDSGLFADIYVPTRDVGLIRIGMPVRLQIDAFRATEWGFVPASVTEIASDFELIGQTAAFRVRCALARRSLQLSNGAVGSLKKGMTVQANFLVARRTAFQLLFDRLNDWINPQSAVPKASPESALHPASALDRSVRPVDLTAGRERQGGIA